MKHYAYLSSCSEANAGVRDELISYAQANGIVFSEIIEDPESHFRPWTQRKLFGLLTAMAPGDALVVYEAISLARSTSQILDIFEVLAKRK